MAMAAADPSPAAVITWARGLTTLPATQTPAMLVRPLASVIAPVAVEFAAEADEQVAVRDEPWRDKERIAANGAAVVQLETAEAVVVDEDLPHGALDDADRAG